MNSKTIFVLCLVLFCSMQESSGMKRAKSLTAKLFKGKSSKYSVLGNVKAETGSIEEDSNEGSGSGSNEPSAGENNDGSTDASGSGSNETKNNCTVQSYWNLCKRMLSITVDRENPQAGRLTREQFNNITGLQCRGSWYDENGIAFGEFEELVEGMDLGQLFLNTQHRFGG
ncbi:uncharacterized protein LOC126836898 [Adelges cooleyi]|uniref:uncharacterized protein LOC126836898 n=1 Tax=Adelges cooleyi TaxID=133065 RepID=UPI00217F7DB6|nr:uncharacterized protein LOC126836898 [Adelges cooleyi]